MSERVSGWRANRDRRYRERVKQRQAHNRQLLADMRARIEAERADMQARWRAAGRFFDRRQVAVVRKRELGAVLVDPVAELSFLQALAREVRR